MELYDNDFCCMELYDKHFWCMEVNPGTLLVKNFVVNTDNFCYKDQIDLLCILKMQIVQSH